MSIITGGLAYQDRLGNELYTDFRNMLRIDELFCGEATGDAWYYALQLLYGDFEGISATSEELLHELKWFYNGGNIEPQNGPGHHEDVIDFEIDADYIYADFLTAYGIDLTDDSVTLHWWQFLALLRALPESTSMAKRMYYRSVNLGELKGKEKSRIARIKKEIAIRKKNKMVLTAEEKEQQYKERMRRRVAEAKGE
jgi:hypothetical protein